MKEGKRPAQLSAGKFIAIALVLAAILTVLELKFDIFGGRQGAAMWFLIILLVTVSAIRIAECVKKKEYDDIVRWVIPPLIIIAVTIVKGIMG